MTKFRVNQGGAYGSFLFLFVPFMVGLIFFRFFGQTLETYLSFAFFPALVLLLLSAASLYGAISCLFLFFMFGCCAVSYLSGFSVHTLPDRETLRELLSIMVWFPAVFCCGRISLDQCRKLRCGMQAPAVSCLKANLYQILLLGAAVLFDTFLFFC